MAAGNWVPELVEWAGGVNLFGEAGKHSPGMTWEDLLACDPDVIVVMPCGFDLSRTKAELRGLTNRPGWDSLKAVRTGRVWAADGNAYFNRPGPRLAEALEMLAEAFHPEACRYGHTGMERV
jgi:iron complex transport system substrate-binding protein